VKAVLAVEASRTDTLTADINPNESSIEEEEEEEEGRSTILVYIIHST